jgi:broad specificity phosphatase PhoE
MLTPSLILLRHGQTAWNVNGIIQGHAAVPINKRGRQQAEALGKYLRKFSATRLYSSDLVRARLTAEIINATLRLPMTLDSRLRELDAGQWQGLRWDQVRDWDPAGFEEYAGNKRGFRRPNGENYPDLRQRASAALSEYMQRHPNEVVLVMTHGGLIHELLLNLVGIEPPQTVQNASFTPLYFDATTQHWSVEAIGCTPHLNPELLMR